MTPMPVAQWLLRLVLLLAPAAALLAVPGSTSAWWLALALVLGVLAWRRPDSLIGLAVLALVGWRWVAVPGHELPAMVLVSVTALVAFEVASVLASHGPSHLRLQPAVLRLWAIRAVVLLAPACVVFLAGRGLQSADGSTALWVVGVLAATAALVVLRDALGLAARDSVE